MRIIPAERREELLAYAKALEAGDYRCCLEIACCEKHGGYKRGWGWFAACPMCTEQPEPLAELLTDPSCWPGHEFFWSEARGHRGMWEYCEPGERFPVRLSRFKALANLLSDIKPEDDIIEAAVRQLQRRKLYLVEKFPYEERNEDVEQTMAIGTSYASAVGLALRLIDICGGGWRWNSLRQLWEELREGGWAIRVSAMRADSCPWRNAGGGEFLFREAG